MVTLHQPKSLVKSIVVTPAARPLLAPIISLLTSESILVRNRMNAPVARNNLGKRKTLLVT